MQDSLELPQNKFTKRTCKYSLLLHFGKKSEYFIFNHPSSMYEKKMSLPILPFSGDNLRSSSSGLVWSGTRGTGTGFAPTARTGFIPPIGTCGVATGMAARCTGTTGPATGNAALPLRFLRSLLPAVGFFAGRSSLVSSVSESDTSTKKKKFNL